MNAPKKIWVDELFEAHEEKILANDIHYIRSDLVDGLVEALKTCRFSGHTDIDGDYITTQHFDGPKVRVALNNLEEE